MQSKNLENYRKELSKQQREHFSAVVKHPRQTPEKEYPAVAGGGGWYEWALLRQQKGGGKARRKDKNTRRSQKM